MKKCTKCLVEKDESNFYIRRASVDGLAPRCKCCDRVVRAAHYEKNWERERGVRERWIRDNKDAHRAAQRKYLAKNKKKKQANQKINNGIRDGKVKRPDTCDDCGKTCKPQGHHEDYDKPLDVVWVCTRCHGKRHQTIEREEG